MIHGVRRMVSLVLEFRRDLQSTIDRGAPCNSHEPQQLSPVYYQVHPPAVPRAE